MIGRISAAAATAAALAASPAHAIFVDFTDTSLFVVGAPTSVVTNVGGVNLTISGSPEAPNFNFSVAAPSASFCNGGAGGSPDFACGSSGAGIGASNPDQIDGDERLTVSFSQTVEVTAFYLLNFFVEGSDRELAAIDYRNGSSEVVVASEAFSVSGNGFASFTGRSQTTSLLFLSELGDGIASDVGFALAGLEFNLIEEPPSVIPLPAGLPLLLSALGAFMMLGRRRR